MELDKEPFTAWILAKGETAPISEELGGLWATHDSLKKQLRRPLYNPTQKLSTQSLAAAFSGLQPKEVHGLRDAS